MALSRAAPIGREELPGVGRVLRVCKSLREELVRGYWPRYYGYYGPDQEDEKGGE